MGQENDIVKELRAYEAWAAYFAKAQEIRQMFVAANLPPPLPLQRILGETNHRGGALRAHVPPPDSPPKPEGVTDEWISIAVVDATPTTLLLAILRNKGGVVASREIVTQLTKLQPSVNPGSIFNIFTRLEGKRISRADDGWQLTNPESAPVLRGDVVWWLPREFTKHEVASHRRAIIKHLLRAMPGGLQVMQLVDQLNGCDYCRAPVNKDLLKGDMEAMQEAGIIKRIGGSKKYVLVDDQQSKK